MNSGVECGRHDPHPHHRRPFDKLYDEIGARLHFTESQMPEMLRLGRSRGEVAIRTVMPV